MAKSSNPQEVLPLLDAIPTPTETAARMLELARDRDATAEDFADVIATDPGLTAELMRNSNDPDHQHNSPLDLRAAATTIHRDELERLAFCTTTPENAPGRVIDEGLSGMVALRSHSVAVAVAARELARLNDHATPEEAYGAGLLSAMGSLALATLMPEEAGALRRQVSVNEDESILEQERNTFGFDSDQMAAALAESWDFSIEMQDILYFLNRSVDAIERDCPSDARDIVSFVRAGIHLASQAGYGLHESPPAQDLSADVRELLDGTDCEALTSVVHQAVESAKRVATPEDSRPEARMVSLRVANNELAHLLAQSEHKRQGAHAVTAVMQYGLHRLGDGDPLPGVMYCTMETMGFKRMTFVEIEPEYGHLSVKLSSALRGSHKAAEGSQRPFPGESGFPVPAIITRDSAQPEHSCLLDLIGVDACVLAPVAEPGGEVIGYLVADRGVNGSIPVSGDEHCLAIIADQAALLLNFERLSREQARMATVDPLTGAATRRRLMDRLESLISLSGRTQIPLSLAMMDLDHFKAFNDTLGHQVGDKLLQDLVKVLSGSVRKADLVARYGGEEFIVVFPDATLEGAFKAADSLREKVFAFGQEHAAEYDNLPISISIGVAQLRTDENGCVLEDAMALIGRADEVLYEAKHNGRNRVERAA